MGSDSTNQHVVKEFFSVNTYSIPDYQRGYAWTTQNVRDLLNDIEFMEKGESGKHYIGTIVSTDSNEDSKRKDIIDGQQRVTTLTIFFSNIYSELEKSLVNSGMSEDERSGIESEMNFIENTYIMNNRRDGFRLSVDKDKKNVFKKVIETPEDISDSDLETPSHKRMFQADEEIKNWLSDEIFGEYNGPKMWKNYANRLVEISQSVTHDFDLTVYHVGDKMKAGRMFSVLNDRGKDLNLADKVKSHLIYVASEIGDEDMIERIYDEFSNLLEVVVGPQMDDSEIDTFMKAHWVLFSGEHNDGSEFYRKLKTKERFAKISADEEHLKEWITEYLDSIHESAESYHIITNPLDAEDAENDTILKRLYILRELGQAHGGKLLPLVIAMNNKLPAEKFDRILTILENAVIREVIVKKRKHNLFANMSNLHAHRINWMGREDRYKDLHNSQRRNIYDTPEDAVQGIAQKVDELSNVTDRKFEELLIQPDIVNGEYTDGWTGVHKKKFINYLLFEYENDKRVAAKSYGNDEMKKWLDGGMTREHIHPESSTSEEIIHEGENYTESLGNFAIMTYGKNGEASDAPFDKKKERVYRESEYEHVSELCDDVRKETWTHEDCRDRGERLAEFADERW